MGTVKLTINSANSTSNAETLKLCSNNSKIRAATNRATLNSAT